MSLHPILALDHVIAEYRDYLHSEFRAKDPGLRKSLEAELDKPLFLAQEPFFQAHRLFRKGKRWRDLPLDAKLARVMEERSKDERAYLHQSAAIGELLSPSPRPVVVTTGTGSGKTEAFLLPVIQNALQYATRFKKNGLTAILVYPMNALANDQELRINEYLTASGFAGVVKVAKYDRGTTQTQREDLRKNPPHILLTNYMMLEYLLVRPADREDIFANHRCRFLVLDEVHTYRGTLGSNIALLIRRVKAHLSQARQDWKPDVPEAERASRYPALVPVGTSATIKSVSENGISREEANTLRDQAVQEFFAKLTGAEPAKIRVFGEELETMTDPAEAAYPPVPVAMAHPDVSTPAAVAKALCALAGVPGATPLEEAARKCRLLWDLNRWLIGAPSSVTQLAARLRAEVSARKGAPEDELRKEIEAGLVVGAALPDGASGPISGALRLRVHRFLRGGWRFHRCVNPECGRLYPMGEEKCHCGHATAPLYLCRNCGADYLRFIGNPEDGPLRPSANSGEGQEYLLYVPAKFEAEALEFDPEEEGGETGRPSRKKAPKQMKGEKVLHGSFDVHTLTFSDDPTDYDLAVTLAPARTQCLCCGGSAGSRNVLTPVSLGTSAALKVAAEGLVEALAKANQGKPGHDGKERLLIFSDSRQDAAHQARFILFASRYDRMRRRVVRLLDEHGPLSLQRTVELLGDWATKASDNPHAPDDPDEWIGDDRLERVRAWEEAPVLDEFAVNAGYRGTVANLGLVGVAYNRLGEYVEKKGRELARGLGIEPAALEYLCRCILDECRVRGALSRRILQVHPNHPSFPDAFRHAEWERRMKWPSGFAATEQGTPVAYLPSEEVPEGIACRNPGRSPGGRGRAPKLERLVRSFLDWFGGVTADEATLVGLVDFLRGGQFLVAAELYGTRKSRKLLQVNAEVVRLVPLTDVTRFRCTVCGAPMPLAAEGLPCPRCHGTLRCWPEVEVGDHRAVKRIRSDDVIPLVAREHTAQVTNDDRIDIEEKFKASAAKSKVNVLACSPTLEMGIDVGGLDAVALRNVPPRPDNYAQRGGRAGRRSRVGLVLGYARSTPHDQYFYDKPAEMIAGEVPAPALALGNRDVLLRHVNAIAFGAADPGLAGKMVEYVSPQGKVKEEAAETLLQAVRAQFAHARMLGKLAFGDAVFNEAGISDEALQEHLETLPGRIRDVLDRTARQVVELRHAVDAYAQDLQGKGAAMRAGDLVGRLLGIPSEGKKDRGQADDRSAGYPLRRFAEFGILPGYEFPTEPAALRLLGDPHEEDPVTVGRRFGLAQFQPDAQVYARAKRWKVIGLDTSSPWNPQNAGASWLYRICSGCGLHYRVDQPRCPRCRPALAPPSKPLPAAEFAGFLARRDESPVLDEEERYQMKNLVRSYPQWDGDVVGRWGACGWSLRLSRGEEVQWLNEGLPPTATDKKKGVDLLHPEAKGFLLCGGCGAMLTVSDDESGKGGRKAAKKGRVDDPYGHRASCPQLGQKPAPLAMATATKAEILRLLVPVPEALSEEQAKPWGLTLGYALRAGMRHLYMLDGPEIEFELEGPWLPEENGQKLKRLSLAFIDPSLGGTGYLRRIADELHLVARRALEHLDHPNCETACYRCLKSYVNQRNHEHLRWPLAVPALEALAEAAPEARPEQVGDIDDPKPWLEAYAAGVESPLELKFWKLFEAHGFHPRKQVPVAPTDGEASISIADFAVPEKRLAIYVDGAAFHVGANLRRDRAIRERLRNGTPGWRVVVLRAKDLSRVRTVVEELLAE